MLNINSAITKTLFMVAMWPLCKEQDLNPDWLSTKQTDVGQINFLSLSLLICKVGQQINSLQRCYPHQTDI